ncbi:MAG: alpha/beta fold hydrolase [Leifsonia sp.]|uniref:alpha/beta fold hydrolase n=1 Tax=Leifsonia sp. TaxID=1870902 RepID=UPI003F7DF785
MAGRGRVRRALDRLLRRPPLLHIAGDEGEGPVVVLVHGIASSSVTFQNLVPLLEPTRRVVSIDILGFGRSPAPADARYTIEEHEAALASTLRSLRLREPFVLVGHSLGSLIVTRYAARHPGALARLVLVGPPIYGSPAAIGDRRVRSRVSAYLRAYEFLRANKDFTIRNARILARLLPIKGVFEITERNWTPFVRSLENCIEQQTVVSDLARVRVPVEVVYGTLDAFIAPGSLAVIETMRHVTMHRVEANDHIIRKRLARVVAAACVG